MKLQEIIECINYLSKEDIRLKCRDGNIIILRNIYYKIAKENTRFSLGKIGKAVNKDHSTVLHGLSRIELQLTWDDWSNFYKSCLDTLKNNVYEDETKFNVVIKYIDRIVEAPAPESKLPKYILNHLEQYTDDDLLEVFKTRLEPFKKMLDIRIRQKEIKEIKGSKLIR